MMSPQRYGRNIVAPPGNQVANRENKPRPGAMETTEVRAIESDRHAGVSRGHSSRRKRALTVAGRSHPDEGPNGAARRMAGVNESG